MVFRLEEAAAAVAAPGHSPQRVCAAVFEATRFLMFASDATVVVLAEAAAPRAGSGSTGPTTRSNPTPTPRHAPQFELWQVWNVRAPVRSVRFNPTLKTARGALALCVDEGRGVLLMPVSAAVSALAARAPPSTADAHTFKSSREMEAADFGSGQTSDVAADYVKTHLHLQLPTWKETVRWRSEDRSMSDLRWVERGEDLLLVGAGEKITVWKLVDDAVMVYMQHSFSLGGGAELPVQTALHFDVAQNGRMVATAGAHDRLLKVWALDQLTPREGSPMRLLLPHARALVAVQWAKNVHTFGNVPARDSAAVKCEMLLTLDKRGVVSIWRENLTQRRSFSLWKSIDSQDFCGIHGLDSGEEAPGLRLATFGLIDNFWTRQVDPAVESFGDLVLGEVHMLSALCLFHYGHGSFSEARQNALFNQRMDGSAKVNNRLLGQRTGGAADTHAGETLVCGNATLKETFSVHLLYGVHANGDLSLFRTEFISYSGVTPRVSLLATCSHLRHELAGAVVYRVSSSDYKDREHGTSSFTVLVVFQRTKGSTTLKIARLRLQATRPSSPTGRNTHGTVSYAVQECEVGDVCSSVLNAPLPLGPNQKTTADGEEASSPARRKAPHSCAAIFRGDMGISTDTLDLFRVSPSLRSARMVHQLDCSEIEPSVTLNAYDKSSRLIFVYASGVLRGYNVHRRSPVQPKADLHVPVEPSQTAEAEPEMVLCCSDVLSEDGGAEDIDKLITVGVPESVKKEWSSSLSMFGGQSAPVHRDYAMVVGLKTGGAQVVVWVFQIAPSEAPSDRVKLFRKSVVDVPLPKLLSIHNVPFLEAFQISLATVDSELALKLWTLDDVDDPRALKLVHRADIASLLAGMSQPTQQEENMAFHTAQEEFTFKLLKISSCGRAAVLVESGDKASPSTAESCKVCILSVLDTSLEGIVSIPPKHFGEVISLEWTPFVTPEHDCALLFVTSTSIGMIKLDYLDWKNRWNISWTSSRFDVRLHAVASLSNYPYTWVSIGPSFSRINLLDLDVGSLTVPSFPAVTSKGPLDSAPESRLLPAHHPVMLMYLLTKGCFQTLEAILEDVKDQVVRHEQHCYLRMMDDAQLKALAPIPLATLIKSAERDDERSEVYMKGKPQSGGTDGLSGVSATPARASDLFADFGAYRRPTSTAAAGSDRADMLFAPPPTSESTSLATTDEVVGIPEVSAIERDVFVAFFKDHKDSLTFLPRPSDASAFLDIIGGMKKVLQWERDGARKKDAAALRFYASLLWSFEDLEVVKADDADDESSAGTGAEGGGTGAIPDAETALVRGICSEQVAWAAVSDFQNEIVQECFPVGKVTWKEMQQLRLPFWVRSASTLVSLTEKVAQAEFASTHDPFAVAVFYVVLGKTKLLASLFKMANQTRIFELLSNDFSDSRWKNAAIKNAYVLKAKQRYALSAAFFLLGGKAQEAIAVAEHEDKSLVLPFLIARVYEKWDLGGQGDGATLDMFGGGFATTSITGLSSSLRSVSGSFGAEGQSDAVESTRVCADFLNTALWSKAERYEDVYSQFLVKYLTGDASKAVDCLLRLPKGDMRCVFSQDGSAVQSPSRYWRMFGETLLGASEIVRFLRKTISPIKVAVKEQIVKLNAIALSRMQGVGLTLGALFQQRDSSSLCQELTKASPTSTAAAELLSCRLHILTSAIGGQVDFLYTSFVKGTRSQLVSGSAAIPEADFEERVDEAIDSVVTGAGVYLVEGRPETQNEYLEAVLKQATVDSLKYSGRLAALDFLVARWNAAASSLASGHAVAPRTLASPVPQFIALIIEGIAVVGSGDVVASATDQLHTRRVDQVCSELLSAASRLLIWLFCFHLKPAKARGAMESAGYVRVAASAVYSVICVCSRYIRCPSCLYRVCAVTFPHKPALSKKAEERLRAIASADVCVYCSAYRRPRPSTTPSKSPLLQDDLPSLFQVVQMLQCELENFAADVKTNRLQLSAADSFVPFAYCPYWTMLLVASCNAMPSHVSKIAASESLPPQSMTIKATGQRLVEAWWTYNGKLSKFAVKHLLSELAGLHFSPVVVDTTPAAMSPSSNPNNNPSTTTGSSPTRRSRTVDVVSTDTATPKPSSPPHSPSDSPVRTAFGSRRRLLKCSCDECPWLLVLNLFAEKDELLLRLSGQLDACNEKINNEIAWGRLPEIPSRKVPLTRSQKILLTSNAGHSTASNRTSDLSELIQKRGHAPASTGVSVQPAYRSETNIKGICFNRTSDTLELVYCSNKGICRTSSVDYSDGSKLQFKGTYGTPQASAFFPDTPPGAAQRKVRGDSSQYVQSRAAEEMLPPPVPTLNVRVNGSPGSILSPSPADSKASSFKPTTVESHPFLPLYVSGNHKGQVHLWSFDSLSTVGSFRAKEVVSAYPSSPSMSSRRDVKAIRFDNLGQQMGVVDNTGHLLLWKFASLDRAPYYRDIECHDKGAKGLTFINSGSCIATAGVSSQKRSVCVWDTLLPSSKALVAAPACHPAGATAVVFSATHQLLISGGEGGAISVFDMRQRRVLHNLSGAHETAIKTLALHPSGECLLSGSASGDVKIWSLPIFREVAALGKVHSKQSFLGDAASNILGDAASNMAINVTNLSWGVTDSIATDEYFFTSGTDGSIQRVKVPLLTRML